MTVRSSCGEECTRRMCKISSFKIQSHLVYCLKITLFNKKLRKKLLHLLNYQARASKYYYQVILIYF